MQTRDAKELAVQLSALPLSLLNTHADPGHIGSSDEFDSFYTHPAVDPAVFLCNPEKTQ